ncbi:uncharacterized protein VP01_116g6 [Puccinia sorghi]|uniref:DNA helicase n=1 Tax=Puccinia sorghi TaxID=27349 RepID=A0A0L6VR97_9BASI|nr:uncharacterized protein VP01_116g6 [Puccinia sorghi]
MTTPKTLRSWFDGHTKLLRLERASEKEEFDLLTSEKVKRGQTKLLERMGISIGGLGVRSTNIGLGGKTIVELERPAQYHTDPKLPYHVLRSGVPVGIIDHLVGSSKPSKKNSAPHDKFEVIEGVVSKVSETSIAVTIGSLKDDSDQLELPARCQSNWRTRRLSTGIAPTSSSKRWTKSYRRVRTLAFLHRALRRRRRRRRRAKATLHQSPTKEPAPSASKTSLRKSSLNLTDLMRVLLGIDPIQIRKSAAAQRRRNRSNSPPISCPGLEHVPTVCRQTCTFILSCHFGTGKTHTLVSIIAALHARGDRIIVAAASNLAVDNIAERLIEMKLEITRIGHPARVLETLSSSTLEHQLSTSDESEIIRDLKREINQNLAKLSAQGKERIRGKARGVIYKDVQELRKDYRLRERGHTRNIIKSARIICATAHGAGSRQLENETFDVVIIDVRVWALSESTQAFEAVGDCACWIPILKAKSKLILAGDPLQLPPTVKSMKPRPTRPAVSPSNVQSPGKDKEEEDDTKAEVGKVEEVGCLNFIALKTPPRRPLMKRPRTLETTMFYRLLKNQPEISCLLNVQYVRASLWYLTRMRNINKFRMHEMIMKFPSDQLYESKLTAADLVATHLLKDLPNVTRDETDGIVDPVLLIDTAGSFMFDRDADEGGEGSLMNENEAELVVQRVNALVECGVLPAQIMVISPYAAQVSLLNSLLKSQYPSLAIGSIDSCQGILFLPFAETQYSHRSVDSYFFDWIGLDQGRENEAVIISLCRSNAQGVVGFLSEKRRLNVAMTRAKRHLTVIGDSDTLSKGGPFLQVSTNKTSLSSSSSPSPNQTVVPNWMRWLEDHAEVRVASL